VKPAAPRQKILSRRAFGELGALEASVHELGTQRNQALRIFMASRGTTTMLAQREYWLEFSWADQEYRVAVRRLAEFCDEHAPGRDAPPASL
jgi:hypothetical protein